MPVAIHATEKALFRVFSNDFAFSIPAYQRPYACIQNEKGLDELLKLDTSQLTDSQKNIQGNANYFLKELSQLSEQERERFVRYLMTRCFLVVVSTPDLDSAYRIFSILNARGLDLSLSDFLKSEVIGAIDSSQQEKYTRIWETEEEDLGRETFQELFAHIRMIDRKAKLSETALSEFRKHILPKKEPEKFINELLKPYSDALNIIKTANYQSDKDAETINSLLRWLNQIDNFDWVPSAILYFSINSQTPGKLKKFFTDLERLAAGLFILRADINDRIGRYAKLITAIEGNVDLYALELPLQLTPEEINRIIKTLDGDLYLNQAN